MKRLSYKSPKAESRLGFFTSLRGRLLMFFLGLSLLPLTVMGGLAYWQSQQTLYAQTTAQFAQLAHIQAKNLESWLNYRLSENKVIASLDEARSMNPVIAKEMLKRYAQEWTEYQAQ